MAVEIRLCDADRAKFGGPEWLLLDWSVYDDWDIDRLDQLEQAMGGMSINQAKLAMAQMRARGIKAGAWLAGRLSGDAKLSAVAWDAFKILPLQVETRRPGEVSPPVGGSPESKPGESQPTSAPASTESAESDASATS